MYSLWVLWILHFIKRIFTRWFRRAWFDALGSTRSIRRVFQNDAKAGTDTIRVRRLVPCHVSPCCRGNRLYEISVNNKHRQPLQIGVKCSCVCSGTCAILRIEESRIVWRQAVGVWEQLCRLRCGPRLFVRMSDITWFGVLAFDSLLHYLELAPST